jgi:hypothetical protein
MSYEIYLVRTRPGEKPGDAVDRVLEQENAADSAVDAEDLLRSKLAADSPVDVEAANDSLLLSIPYVRSHEAAEILLQDVFAGLTAAQAQTGWSAFDPQLDRALDLTTDLPVVVEMFEDAIAARGEFT